MPEYAFNRAFYVPPLLVCHYLVGQGHGPIVGQSHHPNPTISMLEASRQHSEFSRYFPRIRGTPPKRLVAKRARAKNYDDVVAGMHNFIDWADKMVSGTKTELNSQSLKPVMHYLFGRFCHHTGVRGAEKEKMKRALDTFLGGVKNEYLEYEKEKPIVRDSGSYQMKGGFRRNQKCYCGSGIKYKRCHIGVLPS
jgi:hypothetical protein